MATNLHKFYVFEAFAFNLYFPDFIKIKKIKKFNNFLIYKLFNF